MGRDVPSPGSWKFGTSALAVSKELMGKPDKKRSPDSYCRTEAYCHPGGSPGLEETGPAAVMAQEWAVPPKWLPPSSKQDSRGPSWKLMSPADPESKGSCQGPGLKHLLCIIHLKFWSFYCEIINRNDLFFI